MELKGSKTEKNLMAAFAGESQARNKYTYYASKAKKEGYEQIAAIFLETADNEKEHAKLWFKEFHGIGSTTENLIDAAAGEHAEWTDMYNWMADEADAEGFARSRRHRKGTRGEISPPAQSGAGGQSVQRGRHSRLEVPQLRTHPLRHGSPRGLPRVRAPESVFRSAEVSFAPRKIKRLRSQPFYFLCRHVVMMSFTVSMSLFS